MLTKGDLERNDDEVWAAVNVRRYVVGRHNEITVRGEQCIKQFVVGAIVLAIVMNDELGPSLEGGKGNGYL